MEKEVKDATFEVAKAAPTTPATLEDFAPNGAMITEEEVIAIERAVPLLKRVKIAALQFTTGNDWTDQGGKPYLKASGAESLANTCGISWNNAKMEVRKFNDEMGQYVEQYICTMTFYNKKRAIEVDGMASTDDDFFSERTNYETKEKYRLPFSEVDVNSIRKKAVTNCIERGVRKFLGLGGVTWEELAAAGITPGEAVAYKKEGKKTPIAPTPGGEEARSKLWGMLLDLANGDEATAKAGCKKYSTFAGKDGPVSFDDPNNPKVSEKWIGTTYGKVKKIWIEKGFDKIQPPTEEFPDEPGMNG